MIEERITCPKELGRVLVCGVLWGVSAAISWTVMDMSGLILILEALEAIHSHDRNRLTALDHLKIVHEPQGCGVAKQCQKA